MVVVNDACPGVSLDIGSFPRVGGTPDVGVGEVLAMAIERCLRTSVRWAGSKSRSAVIAQVGLDLRIGRDEVGSRIKSQTDATVPDHPGAGLRQHP